MTTSVIHSGNKPLVIPQPWHVTHGNSSRSLEIRLRRRDRRRSALRCAARASTRAGTHSQSHAESPPKLEYPPCFFPIVAFCRSKRCAMSSQSSPGGYQKLSIPPKKRNHTHSYLFRPCAEEVPPWQTSFGSKTRPGAFRWAAEPARLAEAGASRQGKPGMDRESHPTKRHVSRARFLCEQLEGEDMDGLQSALQSELLGS